MIAARGRSSARDDATTDRTLRSILKHARRAVPGGDEAGIVLVTDGVAAMAAGTAHMARQLDRTQCESGRGPGLEAMRQLQVFNVGCLASSSSSWPDFSWVAARLGVASSLSVPVTWAGRALGVLGVYSSRPDAFAGCEAAGIEVAREAALALASLQGRETLHRRRRWHGFDAPAVLPAGRSTFGVVWPVADATL
ncbi:MAG: GAF domain-containing protein [Actinomycetota bacterium]|nr:GAF domain-containing protein [Actinomycetota bacterium]